MRTSLFTRQTLAAAVAATLGLSLPAVALAQGVLEEVIVTAQKREQSLQDVPVAVSAFTGEMLQQSGVKDMFDLQVNAPSLRVGQSQTSTTTTFAIRGVFTSSQNFGLEPSVGLYVDGVYRARQGSMINNLVDVGSVEVLRGPRAPCSAATRLPVQSRSTAWRQTLKVPDLSKPLGETMTWSVQAAPNRSH